MFTGLIREVGVLRAVRAAGGGVTRLDIRAPGTAPRLEVGDSVAVNGICLTVTGRSGATISVEAATETRRLTTLAGWRAGMRLHLEPALRAGDALDGHLVLGHVDGTGRVARIARRGRDWLLTVRLPARLARLLLPKGSVAVDGVSLTVDEGPFTDRFTVNLIPHTLAATRFASLRVGEAVNLEMDMLVKAARGEGLPGELRDRLALPAARPGRDIAPAAGRDGNNEAPPPGLTVAAVRARGFRAGRRRASTGSRRRRG
jgi:riboflavin synthase